MKRIKNYSYLTLFLLLPFCSSLKAGTTSAAIGAVTSSTFDPETGDFFVANDTAGETLLKYSRVAGTTTPTSSVIGNTVLDALTPDEIQYFQIGTGSTAGRYIAATVSDAASNHIVYVTRTDTSATGFNSAALILDSDGGANNDILGFTICNAPVLGGTGFNSDTTGEAYIITAVKDNASGTAGFGVAGDGLGIIGIRATSATDRTPIVGAGTIANAVAVAAAAYQTVGTAPTVEAKFRDIVFSPHIKSIPTDFGHVFFSNKIILNGASGGEEEAMGVIAARLAQNAIPATAQPVLTLLTSMFFTTGVIPTEDLTFILGVRNTAGNVAHTVDVQNLAVMKCSTGPCYLITSGGAGAAAATTNVSQAIISALPLVSSGGNAGQIAKIDSGLVNGEFTVPAALVADFPQNTDVAVKVGGGNLPINPANNIADVVKLKVVDDTVYAIVAPVDEATYAGGVFYSHPLYDNAGKIARWTDWAAILPPNESGSSTLDGSCFAAEIDTATGRMWFVSNDAKTIVKNSRWYASEDDAATWFIGQINGQLGDNPCYCSFDLGQHVDSFGNEIITAGPTRRYAFFGTEGKVVAVATGITLAQPASHYNAQVEFADRAAAANAAISMSAGLPATAKVLSLGWTGRRTITEDNNYFLAGTNQGLYAWGTSATAGFQTDALDSLAIAPFTTGSWVRLTVIPATESVIKIVTDTDNTNIMTYILTRSADHQTSKIYRISGDGDTITELQAELLLLADNTFADFSNVNIFYDIDLISDPSAGVGLQLVITTDNGTYISTVIDGLLTGTTTAAAHNFVLFKSDTFKHTSLIRPTRTRLPNMLWAVRNTASADNIGNHTDTIMQLGMSTTPNIVGQRNYVPASGLTSTNQALADFAHFGHVGGAHYDHLQQAMWTNGSLRFVLSDIVNDGVNQAYNQVLSVPYNLNRTGQTTRYDIMAGADLNRRHIFYWINEIAGRIMVGTNSGVMSLE